MTRRRTSSHSPSLIVGVSSGNCGVPCPAFLSTIAKASPQLANRSGQVGTLHQLAIVIGLFTAQIAGYIFTGEVSVPFNRTKRRADPSSAATSWEAGATWCSFLARAAVIQVYSASYIFAPTDEQIKSVSGTAQDEESLDAPGAGRDHEGRLD